ncbi:hypothetical protein H072_1504 [Dactylellina haptotyla CBS 200.50]|uniref:Peptidase metallopeptidase domain-containing protein n=1 Tax=Dactylellina haptotyla (strain CBS 200.50) TaxID=1284197 RepID=S8AU63_DACHA|nr:hypothetical protein H072_1504 [Dactylellina haptotyla CBS 200.50]
MIHVCGHADHDHDGLNKRQNNNQYQNGNARWPQGEYESAIGRAFEKWNQITRDFTFQKANGNANITISVAPPGTRDNLFPSKGPGYYIFAYAQIGPRGYGNNLNGWIKFNNSATGTPNWTTTLIHNVFVHEFGHIMGLGHSRDPNALMAPSMKEFRREIGFTNSDVQAFNAFYGKTTIPNQMRQQPQNTYNQRPQRFNQGYGNQRRPGNGYGRNYVMGSMEDFQEQQRRNAAGKPPRRRYLDHIPR